MSDELAWVERALADGPVAPHELRAALLESSECSTGALVRAVIALRSRLEEVEQERDEARRMHDWRADDARKHFAKSCEHMARAEAAEQRAQKAEAAAEAMAVALRKRAGDDGCSDAREALALWEKVKK